MNNTTQENKIIRTIRELKYRQSRISVSAKNARDSIAKRKQFSLITQIQNSQKPQHPTH
jgi:hypothetical protein